jgi:hypothetical protein
MFGKKKDNERILTHDKVDFKVQSNPDDVRELIDIINENISKVPTDIYSMIKGIPDDVLTSDHHDSTRKALLKAMCLMARNNEDIADKVTKKIVNIAESKEV